jgi:hypothetical protein
MTYCGTPAQRALKKPLHIGKQGNFSQLGGEFILGPRTYHSLFLCQLSNLLRSITLRKGNTCSFAHYMRHTEDREYPRPIPLSLLLISLFHPSQTLKSQTSGTWQA